MSVKRVSLVKRPAEKVRQGIVWLLLGALGIIFALPFIFVVSSALKTPTQIVKYPPEWIPNPVTFRSFSEGFAAFPFVRYFMNSVCVTGLALLGNFISTTLVAYGFARLRARLKNMLFGVLLSTIMIPWLVTFIPLYVIYSKLRLLNTYVPLVLPYFLSCHVFSVFLLRQFFLGMPKELDEAAKIDGCNLLEVLARVIVPNAKPGLFITALFVFVGSWNDFFAPLIYLNDPDSYTISVGLALWNSASSSNLSSRILDIGPLMAMSLVSVLPIIILYIFAQRYFIEGILTTGLKG